MQLDPAHLLSDCLAYLRIDYKVCAIRPVHLRITWIKVLKVHS